MSIKFKIGDKVTWNSEAGRVKGRITFEYLRSVFCGMGLALARHFANTLLNAVVFLCVLNNSTQIFCFV
jgi:hypothetical protein